MKIAFSLLSGRSTIHLDLTGSLRSPPLNAPFLGWVRQRSEIFLSITSACGSVRSGRSVS